MEAARSGKGLNGGIIKHMKKNGSDTGDSSQKQKKKPTKKQKRIRAAIITVAILLALGATGAAVWFSNVRAPDINNKPNDATIKNIEDGDEPALDMGDRIADYFTFVVGAVDEDQTRTDALMVCGFDTKTKKISILNIPRDTMSNVSRRGAARKINAAYGTKKGIEQTKAEIKKVVGFTPDYYIVVNFQGIADIVDAIGGVDYEVPFRMYYKDPTQNLDIDFKPGMTHMDGEQVVEFLRWRKNNGGVKTGDSHYTGGDEERITKQQDFLKYLASQVLQTSNITKIPDIANAVFSNVKTDLTAGEILWMGMQAVGTPSENIQMHTLPGYDAMSYADTGTPYSFFFPDEDETLTLVNEYFNPYVNRLTNLDIVSGPDKYSGSSGSSSSSSSSSSNRNSSNKRDDEDEDGNKSASSNKDQDGTSNSDKTNTTDKDPENGGTGESTESGGNAGDKPGEAEGGNASDTETPPPDGGTSGTETTPPAGGADQTTPPPADSNTSGTSGGASTGGGDTSGGTEAPPATAPDPAPPAPATTTPPAATADPEA